MVSVNNLVQFNHLHKNSTQPLSASVDPSMKGDKVVLLLYIYTIE